MIESKQLEPKFLISRNNYAYARAFLNRVEEDHTGSIKADLSVAKNKFPKSSRRKGFYFSLRGNIEIRDCSTRIDLTLEGSTKNAERRETLENTKNKLRKIISVCEAMLDAIADAERHKDFR